MSNTNNPETPEESQGQISAEALEAIAEQGQIAPAPAKKDNGDFISQNVLINQTPLEPYSGTKDPEFPMHLFRATNSEIAAGINNLKNTDPTLGEEGKRWVYAIRGAQKMRIDKGLFEKSLQNEDTNLRQYMEVGGQRVYSRSLESPVNGHFISGSRSISHIRHVLSLGEDREVPLMASGFYITLRAIADTELSSLETTVLSEKEEIGRSTGGASLSATAVYLVDHVVNMILSNLVETNVKVDRPDQLLDLILVTDIQALALGQAQSIFPKGYPIEVPCTKDYEACQHVDRFNLNLRYMAFHDNSRLTEYQKVQIGNPELRLKVSDVKKYQEEGPVVVSKYVESDDKLIRIDFRTPTLREYIEDGRGWIDGIASMVDALLGNDVEPFIRRREIDDRARLTTLRQYGHFINSITVRNPDGSESTIKDRESLLASLSDLSALDELLVAVAQGVRDHIEAATITTVGVPKTPCPNCEADVVLTEEEKKHPKIVPVDAMNLFFTLLSLKLAKRQETKLQDI